MIKTTKTAVVLLTMLLGCAAADVSALAQVDEQALLSKIAPSIVIVKLVMKSTGAQGGENEAKADVPGVVVDKNGLIMLSNIMFSYSRIGALMGRGGGGQGQNFKSFPTSIKTLFDKDDKEYATTLVATDTRLDLMFVRVEGAPKLTPIEFSPTTTAHIGQRVLSILRLHKGFDYAAYFQTSQICGIISKPKRALFVEGGLEGLGLPVFSERGEALGVLTTLEPGVREEALVEGMNFHNLTYQVVGGKSGLVPTFVLPAQTVAGLISQAKMKAGEARKP